MRCYCICLSIKTEYLPSSLLQSTCGAIIWIQLILFDFVYQHIKNLRKKITNAGGNDYIQTMYGSGYKFNTRVA
ncbi:helix-turn-helix domain-containing protein [Fulvivirga maritima]|uniref:helix-turn-helix domain-containing protein n=1 Tax=Fulvivirga maritima TaxID=2904247 RepID=UPI002795AC5F|nr:helix-turn-helix domain-containing protein [Fulvivirga maritima]